MNDILAKLERSGSRIAATPGPGLLGTYFTEDLIVEADGIDLSDVAEEIAAMPLLLNAAPIVWRLGGDWRSSHVDPALAGSLASVREAMRSLWPAYQWAGNVAGGPPEPPQETPRNGRTALLFSGGLDSTFSGMRLLEERPILVTVHGGLDLKLGDDAAWQAVRSSAYELAEKFDLKVITVRSNFVSVLSPKVSELCPGLPASWWAAIQHGMGLTGVVAPIMAAVGADKLVVSATHTSGHAGGWGSHPKLEGQLRWSAGSVNHYGYDHSRTDKVHAVAEIARTRGVAPPKLLVCTATGRSENCLRCSKCLRTLGSVLVAGEQPEELGFDISYANASKLLMRELPRHPAFTKNEVFAWGSIKDAAITELARRPDDAFLRWLAELDIARTARKACTRANLLRVPGKMLSMLPGPIKATIRTTIKRLC